MDKIFTPKLLITSHSKITFSFSSCLGFGFSFCFGLGVAILGFTFAMGTIFFVLLGVSMINGAPLPDPDSISKSANSSEVEISRC